MGTSKKSDQLYINIRCQNCQRDSLITHLRFPYDEHDDVATTCQHCGSELHFQDYVKWKYPHLFREHIKYHDLTEPEVQIHFQRLAARVGDTAHMELHICGTETSLSVNKHELQTKSDRVSILLRTSSIGSERLVELRAELESDNHDLRLRFSAKRKILSQISVLLPIDDPMMSIKALNLIRTVAKKVGSPKPTIYVVGYYLGQDETGLPGRKTTQRFPSMFGVLVGFLVGCVVGFIAALIWS